MTQRSPGLVSLTKYIPYEGIPHAGGQYVLAHYQALSGDFEVSAIAPDNTVNRAAVRHSMHLRVRLVDGVGLFRGGRFKMLGDLESAWAGSSINRHMRLAARGSDFPWSEVVAADVVELQWSESFALAAPLARRFPEKPLIGVAHDVITQRWERAAAAARGPLRFLYRAAARRSRRREARDMALLDLVIVFSEKDAREVERISPGTRAAVVSPGLWDPLRSHVLPRDPEARTVLFTGALNRPDNADAVIWFLAHVWPLVRDRVPDATFIAAGALPGPRVLSAVSASPGARATGFVDSLEPFYSRASVFVAPLFTGAGVKFKTVDAMLRAVPVVSTSVGAEGIDGAADFCRIANDAQTFADAVVEQLTDPLPGGEMADRGAEWARSVYSVDAFRRRLQSLYGSISATP